LGGGALFRQALCAAFEPRAWEFYWSDRKASTMRTMLSLLCAVSLSALCGAALGQQGPAPAGANLAPPPSDSGNPPDFSGSWLKMGGRMVFKDGPVPFKPWSKAIFDQTAKLQDDGGAWVNNRIICLPDGGTDVMYTPYAVQWVQKPKEILMLLEYNNQVRRIYMDQKQPAKVEPSYNGHSVGHWEGNVLVVDTIGFNGKSPMLTQLTGPPKDNIVATKALHVTERFHLANGGKQLLDEMTFDDPNTFTRPFTAIATYNWRPDVRATEFICSDAPLDLNG
jgi:hypothetical protein